MRPDGRRELLVSKGWVQATALVILFGFFVLGLLAYRTYQAKPPIPQRTVDEQGRLLYTAGDVQKGQQVFLHNGLMEYGSAFGHGAYLGPDYTADYLRRASDFVTRSHGGNRSDTAARRTVEDFRTNRYDEGTGTLTLTAAQAEAHGRLVGHYSRFFSEPTTKHGLREEAITDRRDLAQLTAFHLWLAAGKRGIADVWPGIALSVVLWLTIAGFYSYYLNFSDYARFYAGLSQLMVALIFFQFTAIIIILGAELNRGIMELKKLGNGSPLFASEAAGAGK